MRIAYHQWQPGDGISETHIDEMVALDHLVTRFYPGDPLPEPVDLVVTNGPFGRLTDLGQLLSAIPTLRRPKFVCLLSEQLWNPALPDRLGRTLSQMAAMEENLFARRRDQGSVQPGIGQQLFRERGTRFRIFGEITRLQESGLLTMLIVASPWQEQFLKRNGIRAEYMPTGYSHRWGELRNMKRDVPVLWLGKPGSRRRMRILRQVRVELERQGIQMSIVDGAVAPYVFGEARTVLLNRTKIVLNLVRKPWDSNYLRFLLAMTNGALVVSESMYPHHPFEAGTHYLACCVRDLTSTISRALSDDPERERITRNAHDYITSELTLRNGMSHMLAKVDAI